MTGDIDAVTAQNDRWAAITAMQPSGVCGRNAKALVSCIFHPVSHFPHRNSHVLFLLASLSEYTSCSLIKSLEEQMRKKKDISLQRLGLSISMQFSKKQKEKEESKCDLPICSVVYLRPSLWIEEDSLARSRLLARPWCGNAAITISMPATDSIYPWGIPNLDDLVELGSLLVGTAASGRLVS